MGFMRSFRILLFWIASNLVASAASAGQKHADIENIGARNINAGQMNFFSVDKEIALGRQLSDEVESASRILDDPEVAEYINRLGQNLVKNSDAKVPFIIKVIESDEMNAIALPGGYFYVNTGLIRAASEEAELAGVMAHEIAHVAARHSTEQVSKARFFNFASLPLIFLGGPAGYAIRQTAGLLMPLQFLRFSRGSEREADFLGLQYLHKAGYDPSAFISFFERVNALENHKTGFFAKAFSTHPLTRDRIARTQQHIQNLLPDREEYVLNSSEFDRIKARVEAIENARKAGRESAEEEAGRPRLKRKTSGSVEDEEESVEEEPSDENEALQLTRK